jgi:hypothetical protein
MQNTTNLRIGLQTLSIKRVYIGTIESRISIALISQAIGHSTRSLRMNRLCELFLTSFLCCLLAMPLQAQEVGQGEAAHHHPAQDQQLHERFYSSWRMPDHPSVSCCNNADCYPTEIKYVDGSIYAKRREDGKYVLVPPEKIEQNRDSPDGRNHLCAPPPARSIVSDTIFCFTLGSGT